MKLTRDDLKGLIEEQLNGVLNETGLGVHSDRKIQEDLHDILTERGLDDDAAAIILSNVPIPVLKELLLIFSRPESASSTSAFAGSLEE